MLPDLYEEDEGARQLEAVIRKEELETEDQAMVPQLTTAILSEFQVIEYDEPKCWKLSMTNELAGEHSPVRMRIQGIISDVEFPPVRKPANTHAMERMRQHIRQAVKLTGLHTEAFQRNMEQLELIQIMFAGALPPGSLKDWTPTYEDNNLVIEAHNRFFTKKSLVPNRDRVSFKTNVDPNNVLDGMQRDGKFIHTLENEVRYFGIQANNDIEPSPANPTLFRPGDIVEISVEFAAFPVGHNQHTTVIVLKGIRMLSCDLRNKAAILVMRSRYRPAPAPKLKRKSTDGPGDAFKTVEAEKRARKAVNVVDLAGGLVSAFHDDAVVNVQNADTSFPSTLVGAPIMDGQSVGESFASTQTTDSARDLFKTGDVFEKDLFNAQELFVKMHVSDPNIDP